MITETKTVYKCDFCKKPYFSKYFAERHEVDCSKNPENRRPCFSCKHLALSEQEYMRDDNPFATQYFYKVNVLYCPKLESCLYPPSVERKGTAFEFSDICNDPMPKECSFYEAKETL